MPIQTVPFTVTAGALSVATAVPPVAAGVALVLVAAGVGVGIACRLARPASLRLSEAPSMGHGILGDAPLDARLLCRRGGSD